jgi:hypothetical protein
MSMIFSFDLLKLITHLSVYHCELFFDAISVVKVFHNNESPFAWNGVMASLKKHLYILQGASA